MLHEQGARSHLFVAGDMFLIVLRFVAFIAAMRRIALAFAPVE